MLLFVFRALLFLQASCHHSARQHRSRATLKPQQPRLVLRSHRTLAILRLANSQETGKRDRCGQHCCARQLAGMPVSRTFPPTRCAFPTVPCAWAHAWTTLRGSTVCRSCVYCTCRARASRILCSRCQIWSCFFGESTDPGLSQQEDAVVSGCFVLRSMTACGCWRALQPAKHVRIWRQRPKVAFRLLPHSLLLCRLLRGHGDPSLMTSGLLCSPSLTEILQPGPEADGAGNALEQDVNSQFWLLRNCHLGFCPRSAEMLG